MLQERKVGERFEDIYDVNLLKLLNQIVKCLLPAKLLNLDIHVLPVSN